MPVAVFPLVGIVVQVEQHERDAPDEVERLRRETWRTVELGGKIPAGGLRDTSDGITVLRAEINQREPKHEACDRDDSVHACSRYFRRPITAPISKPASSASASDR